MGRPISLDLSSSLTSSSPSSSSSPPPPPLTSASNGSSSTLSSSPHYLFLYGNLRPDFNSSSAPNNSSSNSNHSSQPLRASLPYQKAWLMGGRLYSVNRQGVESAALRLEEYGHAVRGCILSLHDTNSSARLLEECEAREHPLSYYERDIVEVVTESGQRVKSYVYHCQEVDRSNPVFGGDWLERRRQL